MRNDKRSVNGGNHENGDGTRTAGASCFFGQGVGDAPSLGPLLMAAYTRRELKQRVGTPNGQGNVVTVTERLLAGQATQDERLGRLEARQSGVEARLSRLEGETVR